MTSSVSTESRPTQSAPPVLRWQRWPLRDQLPASLLVPLGIVVLAAGVAYASNSWLLGLVATLTLIATLTSFLLPVRYEVDAGGFRRRVWGRLGRSQAVSWRRVWCYQPRATGILLFNRPRPTVLNAMSAIFLPFDDQPDDLLVAVRQFLPHAEELPADG